MVCLIPTSKTLRLQTLGCTYVLYMLGKPKVPVLQLGTSLLCSFFYQLCYAAVLKILTYYARYYAYVKNYA